MIETISGISSHCAACAEVEVERIGAQLIDDTRAPFGLHAIAGLQNRARLAALAAGDKARMASMRRGQQRHHGGIFAMWAGR